MEKMIEIIDFCAGYQRGVDVISGINLAIDKGEAIGIVGKNGCGKSTLSKALVGLTPFRSGSLLLCGRSVMQLPVDQMQSEGVSIMLQGGRVFTNLTVWENYQLASRQIKDNKIKQKIIDIVPLLHDAKKSWLNKGADKLSGGERHQLALAMALASARNVLILDEPSAGLMPSAAEGLYAILQKVRETFNTTLLVVEQNVKRVECFATRMVFMDDGKIVYQGNDIDHIEELMLK